VLAGVERGVDRGEADNVRLGAAGGGAEQALLAAGQRPVDGDPPLPGVGVEGQLAGEAREPQRGQGRRAHAHELLALEAAAERELLASPDRDE
jgi:hypothetical protein